MRLLEIEAPIVEQGATENCYDRYRKSGGIIDERAYHETLMKAGQIISLAPSFKAQAEFIAGVAGIPTNDPHGDFTQVAKIYQILRSDTNPGAEDHHSQMCDQELFAQATIISGKPWLGQIIEAHHNIPFIGVSQRPLQIIPTVTG